MTRFAQASLILALLAVAAGTVGCAGQPRPRVAVLRFSDTRQQVDPSIEKKHLFGRNRSVADWTTDELAKRLSKEGFDVTITEGEIPDGVEAVVEGSVYRWDVAALGKFMQYYGTAIARSRVTVTMGGTVVLSRIYTADDTEVHASEALLNPLYNPNIEPLEKAPRNMVDCIAEDVVRVLKGGPARPVIVSPIPS